MFAMKSIGQGCILALLLYLDCHLLFKLVGQPHYFLVLKTSRYGTAAWPSVSLKFSKFSLLTQMAYVFPGSSLTGSTQVRLSGRYFGLPSTLGKLSLEYVVQE